MPLAHRAQYFRFHAVSNFSVAQSAFFRSLLRCDFIDLSNDL